MLQGTDRPEQFLFEKGIDLVAGVDEVGRGPLAGPVVAAAVILDRNWTDPEIRDSKKLSPAKRQKLFQVIDRHCLAWNWAFVDPQEIDRTNILQASLTAMKKAVESLHPAPEHVLVDGPYPIPVDLPQTPIKKGDSKSIVIAAASIMAKVVRDAIMQKYHVLFPHYNFHQNKGYGTREHLGALENQGCCPIHRKSFKRVLQR